MKKFLRFSMLSLLLTLCGTALAEDITISASDLAGAATEETTVQGITFLAEKNSGSTAPTFNNNGQDFRIYAKGTLSVSAAENITKMVFNISTQGKKRLAPITASTGTIATQAAGDETVTWTGDANAIVLTVGDKANYGSDGESKAGQFDFESVTITIGGSGEPAQTKASKPVISPNGGNFEESVSVTISAAEGATISYSLNDGDYQTYTGALTLTETTTVKAYATDETKDVKQSDVVTATFTKVEPQQVVVATCQQVIDGTDGTIYQVKGTCTEIKNTTYGNWYLEDETGTVYIYGTLDAEGNKKNFESLGITVGDIVTVQGPRKDYNGTIELVDVTVISIEKGTSQTVAAAPVITPNGGNFENEVEVTLSHQNPDAEVFYALNNGDFQHYSGPFVLTETTTVKAYAIDEECEVQKSVEVTATFTKVDPQEVVVATCQQVIDGEEGVVYRVTGKCTDIINTTYGNWDLQDETGTIRIYGTLDAEGKTKNFSSLGIEVGDIVTVQGPRKDYNGTIELVDVTVISIEKGSTPDPTIEKIGVEKALEIIAALADGEKTSKEYDVEGYVASTPDFQRNGSGVLYGNVNFEMAATAGGAETLTVYRAKNIDNENFTEETIGSPVKGDKVVVRGLLQKYVKGDVTTPEVVSCHLISVDGTTNGISLTKAEATGTAVYNLNGQRIAAPAKGLYIINGKKVVK